MTVSLKLRAIGNSVGVILPKEVLSRLKLAEGDHVMLTEAPDGFRLSRYEEKVSSQMAEARKIMHERRHVLRELAK